MVKTCGILSLLLGCLLVVLCGQPPAVQAQGTAGDQPAPGKQATAFVTALQRGDFTAAVGQFDARMNAVISAEKLQELWQTVLAQAGTFTRQRTPQQEIVTQGGEQYTVCIVPCEFQRATVPIKVVIDTQAHVCGLFFCRPRRCRLTITPRSTSTYRVSPRNR